MHRILPAEDRIVLAVIAVFVAWGLFLGFRPQPVKVDIGIASRAPLRVTIEQEGRTRVVDRYVVTVKRRLEIGQRNGLSGQVVSGIDSGEQVIVHPDDRVREGARVAAR